MNDYFNCVSFFSVLAIFVTNLIENSSKIFYYGSVEWSGIFWKISQYFDVLSYVG